MNTYHPYTIFPLGEGALTIEFGDSIHESIHGKVLQLFHVLQQQEFPFVIGLVPAYASLSVFYKTSLLYEIIEKDQTAFSFVAGIVEMLASTADVSAASIPDTIRIPVCYAMKFAPDLAYVAAQKEVSIEEVVQIHTSQKYRVYMLGFLPGFPYMGLTDERISVSRKSVPQREVMAGSVGLAGRQTGIYPMNSPGGWQIIGRTPVELFKKHSAEPALLKAGTVVEFYSITEDEYTDHKGGHS